MKINLKLMDKPSGCILWIMVTPDLLFDHYLWFGRKPGEPLPDIRRNMIAKHAKGNAQGEKTERPNHRTIRISKFEKLVSLDMVLERLFGALEQDQTAPVAPDRALG